MDRTDRGSKRRSAWQLLFRPTLNGKKKKKKRLGRCFCSDPQNKYQLDVVQVMVDAEQQKMMQP